jgi:hypothetical protein
VHDRGVNGFVGGIGPSRQGGISPAAPFGKHRSSSW